MMPVGLYTLQPVVQVAGQTIWIFIRSNALRRRKMAFWIFQGKVATSDRLGGRVRLN